MLLLPELATMGAFEEMADVASVGTRAVSLTALTVGYMVIEMSAAAMSIETGGVLIAG